MIVIKFIWSHWKWSDRFLDWTEKWYDWSIDPDYNVKYKFTRGEDYTHAIIFDNNTPNNLKAPKENVIGLMFEPKMNVNFNIDYMKKHVKKFYCSDTKNLEEPFVERWPFLPCLMPCKSVNGMIENFPEKTKIMNYVYSWKRGGGNKLYDYRHALGEKILNENIDVDILGNNVLNLKNKFGPNNKNIKYETHNFLWDKIDEIYKDYKFTIVIENTREPEYFSEKIMVPLLCGSIPIYLGCKNIDNYFKDYVIHLTGNLNDDITIINNVLADPDKYWRKVPISEIRNKIHLKNVIHEEFLENKIE